MLLNTKEIVEIFPNLGRALLYFLEDQGFINPRKVESDRRKRSGKKKPARLYRAYDDEQVRRLAILARYYKEGYSFRKANDFANEPAQLRNSRIDMLASGIRHAFNALIRADYEGAWQGFLEQAQRAIQCECAVIFQRTSADAMFYRVVAIHHSERTLPISSFTKTPSPDWDMFNRAMSWHGDELQLLEYVQAGASHLRSGKYFSLAVVPFGIRRRHGFAVFENRVGSNGIPNEGGIFDPGDLALSELAVECLAGLLAVVEVPRKLVNLMQSGPSLQSYLVHTLEYVMPLLGAFRGDACWKQGDDAIVTASFGPTKFDVGDIMEPRSITGWVLQTGQPRLVRNREDDPYYRSCSDLTWSELCVPLRLPGECNAVGCLNVESTEKAAFNKEDQDFLEFIASIAAMYAQFFQSRDAIRTELAGSDGDTQFPSPAHLRILEDVARELGLTSGIIYIADYKEAKLRCVAMNGCSSTPLKIAAKFSFEFAETSLASKILRDKAPYFSANPQKDFNVSSTGLATFNVGGPVVGLPLTFSGAVIGVMVLWSNRGPNARLAEPDDIARLEPFARLAVTTMKNRTMDREREQALDKINSVLSSMSKETDPDQILKTVVKALVEWDFDRARVFEHKGDQVFVCRASAGIEPDGTYVGTELKADVETEITNFEADQFWPQIRNPSVTGPDPNAAKTGKPLDLEWAVSKLWVGGHLFGYIAGDNKATRRPITKKNLDSMNIFGGLAALSIANLPRKA